MKRRNANRWKKSFWVQDRNTLSYQTSRPISVRMPIVPTNLVALRGSGSHTDNDQYRKIISLNWEILYQIKSRCISSYLANSPLGGNKFILRSVAGFSFKVHIQLIQYPCSSMGIVMICFCHIISEELVIEMLDFWTNKIYRQTSTQLYLNKICR